MYEVKIVQTIGTDLSKEASLKAYTETLEALLKKQGDAPEEAFGDLFNAGVKFLKGRGIEVSWRRQKKS